VGEGLHALIDIPAQPIPMYGVIDNAESDISIGRNAIAGKMP
jgi:hypothetical protein